MTKTDNIASFVLRFTQDRWQDTNGEPHVRWRGHIRHVQGNEENRFTDFSEAIAFMHRYLTAITVETLAGGQDMNPEKILLENFRFWGQFATSYGDIMLTAMEQSLKQSEVFKERIDEIKAHVLKAWRLPGPPDQNQILEVLEDLQQQFGNLSERVKILEEALQQRSEES